MKKMDSSFALKADVIKALAHPARLFIVETLRDRRVCVCELTGLIGSDMSTVSKHISILKKAGLLNMEKERNWIYYSLRCPCILEFVDCIGRVAAGRGAAGRKGK